MVALGFSALVALLVSSVAVAGAADKISPKFKVKTFANNGNKALGGQWLSLYKVSQYENAVVTLPNKEDGLEFQIKNGELIYHLKNGTYEQIYTLEFLGSRPQYLSDDGELEYAAPKAYLDAEAGAGGSPVRQGYFSTGADHGVLPLQFTRVRSFKWRNFAVCAVDRVGAPPGVGSGDEPMNQFLYRKIGTYPSHNGQCADVGLGAHYV